MRVCQKCAINKLQFPSNIIFLAASLNLWCGDHLQRAHTHTHMHTYTSTTHDIKLAKRYHYVQCKYTILSSLHYFFSRSSSKWCGSSYIFRYKRLHILYTYAYTHSHTHSYTHIQALYIFYRDINNRIHTHTKMSSSAGRKNNF